MVKKWLAFSVLSFTFMLLALVVHAQQASAAVYYVSHSGGNDANGGTSTGSPWKTLSKVSGITFNAGDQILLKAGDTWSGQSLTLHGSGTSANPIVLSSYGTGSKPIIAPGTVDSMAIYMSGLSGWSISGLELQNAMTGIMLEYNDVYNKSYIHIDNMVFRNMTHAYNSAPETYNHISAGIDVRVLQPWPGGVPGDATDFSIKNTAIDDLSITNSNFYNCDTANFFGRVGSGFMHTVNASKITNLVMSNLYTEGGMWGFDFHWIDGGTMTNLRTKNVGAVYNPFGVGAIVAQVNRNLVFDGGELAFTRRNTAAYDGVGFDFEGANTNITLKNYYIHDTDGEAIFIFNNAGANTNILVDNNTLSNFAKDPAIADENYAFRILGDSTGTISNTNIINFKPSVAGTFNYMPTTLTYTNNNVYSALNWDFETDRSTDLQNWGMVHDISGSTSGGILTVTSTSGDPYMHSANNLGVSASNRYFKIRLKNNTSATFAEVFFTTNTDGTFTASKSKLFAIAPNMTGYAEYVVDMGTLSGWTGTIKQLRLDPFASTGTMNIDYINLTDSASGVSVTNAGFESPGTPTITYGPVTSGWTFDSNSGVQHNGSDFGAQNAPEGVQTAFIQGSSTSFYQDMIFNTGMHWIQFQASMRTNWGGRQTIQVYCDNVKIGAFSPDTGTFMSYTTNGFYTTAGTHRITFSGAVPGDNTAFIDAVTVR